MSVAEHVALVHGYLANKYMLAPLARRLRRRGFGTTPWGYWNIRCSLLVHADRFCRQLQRLDADPAIGTIHLVTHSMGGIIALAALDFAQFRLVGWFFPRHEVLLVREGSTQHPVAAADRTSCRWYRSRNPRTSAICARCAARCQRGRIPRARRVACAP